MTTPRRIDKRLVHRHHEQECFLREPTWDNSVPAFGTAIDENHNALSGQAAPLVVMLEIARQLSIATCHIVHGVPATWHAIANHMRVEWHEQPLTVRQLNSPQTRAVVTSSVISRNSMAANAISFAIALQHRRRVSATAKVSASWATLREYRILRGQNIHQSTLDTKQSPTFLPGARQRRQTLRSELSWDCRDTFYFDHEADHIPGMVLAGASLEASCCLHPSPTARFIDIHFNRYAELDAPVFVEATVVPGDLPGGGSAGNTTISFTQTQHEVCHATIGAF